VVTSEARPRLAPAVRARRHIVDGRASVVLQLGAHHMQLGAREWTVLGCMDGTRDLRGIGEAARRAGAPVQAAQLQAFVDQLSGLGLIVDAPDAVDIQDGPQHPGASGEDNAFAPDKPVVALPDYHFDCDGRGTCCGIFDAVSFTPVEAARARALLPEIEDGGDLPEAVFTPSIGLEHPLSAVTVRDGWCVYRGSGGCELHAAGGAGAKPEGCRTFPMRYVDAGEQIRVAPRPECACVFASAGRSSPLADPDTGPDPDPDPARPPWAPARGCELPRSVYVPPLPSRVRVGPGELPSAVFWAWCDSVEFGVGVDLARACWMAAEGVSRGELPLRWVDSGELRGVQRALGRWHNMLEAFAGRQRWRAEGDWVRLGAQAMLEAAPLLSVDTLPDAGDVAEVERERFYLRTILFVGALAGDGRSVEADLRQRALHLWTARVIRAQVLQDGGRPAWRFPLAIVEALSRSYGLSLEG